MNDWSLQRVRLAFQLSDWTLAAATVPLQVRMHGLADAPSPVADPMPPSDTLLAGSRGFMLRALPVTGKLPELSRTGGYLRYVPLQYRHYFIDMSGDFKGYQQRFSGKTRSTITRKVRKFSDHCGGTLRWVDYKTPGALREFFPLAREVSRKTYQERLLDAGLPDDPAYLERMLAEAAHDRVRAFLLFDGEKPVSYLFCPVVDGVLVYAYLGYDPKYQRMSVGTVLQWLALEQLFGERTFRYFDLTEGESEHKRLFATDERRCANVIFLHADWRGALLLYVHRGFARLGSGIGALLDRWGLKARVRRLLRFAG